MRYAETVFSLKFSSAGKERFMASKAKMPQRRTFLGGRGRGGGDEEVHIIGVSLRGG